MESYCKKFLVLYFMLLSGAAAIAQVRIEHAEHVQGTLNRDGNSYTFIRKFNVLTAAKASSLSNAANKMVDVVCGSRQFHPPMGFDAKVNVVGSDLGLKEDPPHLKVFCYLRYLVKDSRTNAIKESMDGTDLYLAINAFDLFDQMGNYWKECSKLKLPLFFEQLSLLDSANDYITFQYKGGPARIVLGNNKPLFVPLTRREFVQFLIARKNFQVKEDENLVEDIRKKIKESRETLTHPPSYFTVEFKKALADGVTTQEKQVADLQEGIKKKHAKIDDYREFLDAMSPQEAASPTRLDYDKKSDELMGGLEQLVPVGRKEGVMLTRINPGYYNHSPGAPVAQMLALYYAWPTVGFVHDPDYLQQATIDIFKQLDYHGLKESMK